MISHRSSQSQASSPASDGHLLHPAGGWSVALPFAARGVTSAASALWSPPGSIASEPDPLDLNSAELDVLRALRVGIHRVAEDDPIWDSLEEIGLVERDAQTQDGRAHHALTLLGLAYRTE
jgi:hypothetical protein